MATQNYHRENSLLTRQPRATSVPLGSQSAILLAVVGSLVITVALLSPAAYYQLIREDGFVEYGSALCWALAVATGLLAWKHKKNWPALNRGAAVLLIFLAVCAAARKSVGVSVFSASQGQRS